MLANILDHPIPQQLIKKSVRSCIEAERVQILRDAENYKEKTEVEWKGIFLNRINDNIQNNLRRVINGTGVVIHTNLGRSLLSKDAADCLVNSAVNYTNLEFNLNTGKRGSRYTLVEEIICDLTGAEAALVVNNNAAAVLLVLETLAHRKEAVVSRGQLVEIGGSFRIPDVMEKSGATLVEVGATNRTHLYDYENGISENTALLLKVHTSNFKIVGFTSEVSAEELVNLAHQHDILVMEDLGSGCLVDLSAYGLPREPTVQEVVLAGVDVVTFSGDKLLGGPQAGIIVGKREVIDRIKRNPLNRALRIDKFTLASLENILRNYYDIEQALQKIPTLSMLTQPSGNIKKRAQKVLRALRKHDLKNCCVSLQPTFSRVGGGAMPEFGLESWAIKIDINTVSLSKFESDLRKGEIPLIGRIENEHFLIDFRTIKDGDIVELTSLLMNYFNG
jgi:L-seryl-tRNA(Ser) seleniumtransferase